MERFETESFQRIVSEIPRYFHIVNLFVYRQHAENCSRYNKNSAMLQALLRQRKTVVNRSSFQFFSFHLFRYVSRNI